MKKISKILRMGPMRLKLLLTKPNLQKITGMNFAVTYLCNSRCAMCNIWKKYKKTPELLKKELKLEQIKQIFSSSTYLKNLIAIQLTGGEPFLRKDFVDLCGFFIEKYPKALISIPTNGLNPRLIVEKTKVILELYNPDKLGLFISLDGIGKTHDTMRGVNGAYEKAIYTIKLLKEECKEVDLGTDFTVTPQNYKDLWKVYELSKKYGIMFGADFAQISSHYYENIDLEFQWDNHKLKEAELILRKIIEDRKKSRFLMIKLVNISDYFLANCVKYEKEPKRMFECYSGTHSFFLDPYGKVYPCIMLEKEIGNTKNESFDNLWLSLPARQIREYIQLKKCHCWTECETALSMMRDLRVIKWNLLNLGRL